MKQLSLEEKKDIQARLQVYVSKYPSQNKAVNSLGISAGTISTILNGRSIFCIYKTKKVLV